MAGLPVEMVVEERKVSVRESCCEAAVVATDAEDCSEMGSSAMLICRWVLGWHLSLINGLG